jgi:hypothetical protein
MRPACRRLSSCTLAPTRSLLGGPCLSVPLPITVIARLCCYLAGPAFQLSPPSSNLQSARSPWSRPRSRDSWALPTRPTPTQTPRPPARPVPPTRRHPLARLRSCQSLPQARKTVVARRVHAPFPSPPLRPRHALCLGESRLGVRNSGRASIYSLSLSLWVP